jgi:hypothetical protein
MNEAPDLNLRSVIDGIAPQVTEYQDLQTLIADDVNDLREQHSCLSEAEINQNS